MCTYLGYGTSLNEGGFVRGLGGGNERRWRWNVGRSVPREGHADPVGEVLDHLIGRWLENWSIV